MHPLPPHAVPHSFAFQTPPYTASVQCPPPLTPTTPPPNDQYPSAGPTPHRLVLPSPVLRSPQHPTSALTFCSQPHQSLPLSSTTFEANSNPSASSPRIPHPAPISHPTPKRRRTCPPQQLRLSASRTTSAGRVKKPRIPSSKYAHGLKDFTTTVAGKLRFYGSASYTSVADELVGEAIMRLRSENLPFNEIEVDKNVRRRVYDALNVFSSMGFVDRSAKTVIWKGKEGFLTMVGIPGCGCCAARHTCALVHLDPQKSQNSDLKARIREKRARLEELRRQEEFVQCIVRRNASKDGSRITTGNDVHVGDDLEFKRPDNKRVDLPFIMIASTPGTSVSVEMDASKESIILDFDRAFRLWDGFSIVGRVVQRGSDSGGGVLYDGAQQQPQPHVNFGHNYGS